LGGRASYEKGCPMTSVNILAPIPLADPVTKAILFSRSIMV
jgi:hypothetical protein